jgi:hypothetical protein
MGEKTDSFTMTVANWKSYFVGYIYNPTKYGKDVCEGEGTLFIKG